MTTTRTDILAKLDLTTDGTWIAHSRTLERELTALTAERDQLRAEVELDEALQLATERSLKTAIARAESAEAELAEQKYIKRSAVKRAKELTEELATEREKVRELRECLENLLGEQNGAPLERRREQWQATMDQAFAAIAATEASK